VGCHNTYLSVNIFRNSDSRLLKEVGNLAFLGCYTRPLNDGDGGRCGRGDDDGGQKRALLLVEGSPLKLARITTLQFEDLPNLPPSLRNQDDR